MKKKYLLSKLLGHNLYHNEKASEEFHNTVKRNVEIVDGTIINTKKILFIIILGIVLLGILIGVWYFFVYKGYSVSEIISLISGPKKELSQEELLLEEIKKILSQDL